MTREDSIKILNLIRHSIRENEDIYNLVEERSGYAIEKTEVDVYLQGVSNGFISEILHAVTGFKVEVTGNLEKMFSCKCCGFKSLTETYNPIEGTGYDICPYCMWEDDGTSEKEAYSSVNRGSIVEYRNKIKSNANKYYIEKWFTD